VGKEFGFQAIPGIKKKYQWKKKKTFPSGLPSKRPVVVFIVVRTLRVKKFGKGRREKQEGPYYRMHAVRLCTQPPYPYQRFVLCHVREETCNRSYKQ